MTRSLRVWSYLPCAFFFFGMRLLSFGLAPWMALRVRSGSDGWVELICSSEFGVLCPGISSAANLKIYCGGSVDMTHCGLGYSLRLLTACHHTNGVLST